MGTLRKPDSPTTQDLTEVEKNIGVDLKLTKDNDLELNSLNDIRLVSGGANAAQAVNIRMFVEPEGVLLHPEIGTDLGIGNKTNNAFEIQTQIIASLSRDPRFENVQAAVRIEGNTVFVTLKVTIVDTGIEVPLQFAVIR